MDFHKLVAKLYIKITSKRIVCTIAVADPGFPRAGGANSPGGRGAPTYDFAKISQNLHEIERIWTRGGASKILLCRSATELFRKHDQIWRTVPDEQFPLAYSFSFPVADLHSNILDVHPPPGCPNSFNFMQFWEILSKLCAVAPGGVGAPTLGEILDQPLLSMQFGRRRNLPIKRLSPTLPRNPWISQNDDTF